MANVNVTRAVVIGVIGFAISAAIVLPRGFRSSSDNVQPEIVTFRAVCRTTDRAGRGDYEYARRIFVDQAHDGLHRLAAALSGVDRSLEARLLEAKAGVEAFGNEFTAKTNDSLATLRDATANGVAALTQSAPPRC